MTGCALEGAMLDASPKPELTNDVAFYHIMKTAGTTLARLFETIYGAERMCPLPLYQGADREAFLSGVADPSPRIFTGHPQDHFDLWERIHARPGPRTRIVFLRHPADRAVSCYHFIRDSRFVRARVGAFDLSLAEALESGDPRMADNMMTKVLASLGAPRDYAAPATPADLKLAVRHLAEMDLIGIMEDFDLSYALAAAKLGFDPVPVVKWNVNPKRDRTEDIPKEALALIVRKNVFDFELYELARTMFQSRVAEAGETIQELAGKIRQAPQTYFTNV